MLANSEFLLLFNQAATDRAELAKLLHISDTQMGYITNAEAGHGGQSKLFPIRAAKAIVVPVILKVFPAELYAWVGIALHGTDKKGYSMPRRRTALLPSTSRSITTVSVHLLSLAAGISQTWKSKWGRERE